MGNSNNNMSDSGSNPKEFKAYQEHRESTADGAARRGSHAVGNLQVVNPLQRYSPESVAQSAKSWAESVGLNDDADLFARASLVARDPDNFGAIPQLTDDDVAALDYEKNHKWAGTKMLYFAMFICALGAACQGWDQTGSNGANLSFPQEFGIATTLPNGERAPNADWNEWIIGIINSVPYLAGALPGVWLSDPLNHYLGRRGEIFLTALILIATPIASGFAKNWGSMIAIRIVMGIGIGAKAATVPIYAAEMAPTPIRGALTMGWQLWVCFGIFLGFAANVVVKDVGKIAWRLQLGSAFIPALPLAMFIYFSPESPRWLMKKGRYAEAVVSMKKLRLHPIIAARDLYYSHVLYEEEKAEAQGAGYVSRLLVCFRVPRIRRATLAAGTVMLAQQMCGINIISFYSSTVFKESGSSDTQALYASLGFGALNFAFAIPAVFTIDTFGRRALLLATFPGMAIFLLATGLVFILPVGQTRLGLAATFIYIFTAFYSVGEGPVCFLYGAEVFPTIQREQGMAFSVFINLIFAGVLGLTFPRMKGAMGPVGAFCFYAGMNVLAFIWIFLWVPETKALTLEELDEVFSVPTSEYMKYQTGTWLPYMIKKYLCCGRPTPIPPLTSKSRFDRDDATYA
ncbi:Putative polyol transporter 1 [Vanrija pseudolonga]|uniref:Polyol transporter 1 n=1 Tax=Vanrija pseudolonga TaxID=143232 RepID=A0AAF1BEJ2_9TREE|nr:Putative polyol transporter 1 [Vanrija pseudolonga]